MKLTSSSFDLGQGRSSGLTCAVHSVGKVPFTPRELKKEGRLKGSTQGWCRIPRRSEPQAGEAAGEERGSRLPGLHQLVRRAATCEGLGRRWGWAGGGVLRLCLSLFLPRSGRPAPLLRLLASPRSHSPTPEDNLSLTLKPGASFCPPDSAFSHFCLFSASARFSGKLSSNSLPYSL